MDIPAPLDLHRETVRPEWIDVNGHLNVAYYGLIFDHAVDAFFDFIGVGLDYIAKQKRSVFILDGRTLFFRELRLGQPVRCATHLVDFDAKRLHYWHRMEHAEEGWTAAAFEGVSIHVDLETRTSVPFPDDVLVTLGRIKLAHAHLPRPAGFERVPGLRRRAE